MDIISISFSYTSSSPIRSRVAAAIAGATGRLASLTPGGLALVESALGIGPRHEHVWEEDWLDRELHAMGCIAGGPVEEAGEVSLLHSDVATVVVFRPCWVETPPYLATMRRDENGGDEEDPRVLVTLSFDTSELAATVLYALGAEFMEIVRRDILTSDGVCRGEAPDSAMVGTQAILHNVLGSVDLDSAHATHVRLGTAERPLFRLPVGSDVSIAWSSPAPELGA